MAPLLSCSVRLEPCFPDYSITDKPLITKVKLRPRVEKKVVQGGTTRSQGIPGQALHCTTGSTISDWLKKLHLRVSTAEPHAQILATLKI
jgi:hypothetical protein